MITIPEPTYRQLVNITRHALKQAQTLTIRRDADPELFDYVVLALPDAELIEQAAELLAGNAPAVEPEPKPADPLIPRWINEGEAAFRSGLPRMNGPGGRKGQHWLSGWDRAKADADAAQPISNTRHVVGVDPEPMPPARTPEADIGQEAPL